MTNASQLSDDLTLVRGNHQICGRRERGVLAVSLPVARALRRHLDLHRPATGLGLADLLMGRVGRLEHGGPAHPADGPVVRGAVCPGHLASDAAASRSTRAFAGSPYFGQNVLNGAIYNFSLDNFRNNVKSTVFTNAPAGLIYPGDPGSRRGRAG